MRENSRRWSPAEMWIKYTGKWKVRYFLFIYENKKHFVIEINRYVYLRAPSIEKLISCIFGIRINENGERWFFQDIMDLLRFSQDIWLNRSQMKHLNQIISLIEKY